jgi:membrane protease YdiL (CAAX protease family)
MIEISNQEFDRNLKIQRSIFAIAMGLFIMIAFGMLSSIIMFFTYGHTVNPWVLGLSQLLFMLVPVLFAYKPLKEKFFDVFRFKPINIKWLLILGVGLVFFEMTSEGYLSIQEYLIPESWQKAYDSLLKVYVDTISGLIGTDNYYFLLRALLVVAIIPAISEEFLFRGFIQTTLEKNMSSIWAIGIVSFLFGAMHLNPILFLPLTLAGAYLGYINYITRNLAYPIILHFLINSLSVFAFYFQAGILPSDELEHLPVNVGIVLFTFGLVGLVAICFYMYKITQSARTDPQSEGLDAL